MHYMITDYQFVTVIDIEHDEICTHTTVIAIFYFILLYNTLYIVNVECIDTDECTVWLLYCKFVTDSNKTNKLVVATKRITYGFDY